MKKMRKGQNKKEQIYSEKMAEKNVCEMKLTI
jgi:hypothetical protein